MPSTRKRLHVDFCYERRKVQKKTAASLKHAFLFAVRVLRVSTIFDYAASESCIFFFLSSWSAYVPNIFFVHVLAMSHTKTHVHCTQTNTRAIRKTFDMIHRIAHESHDSIIEHIPRKSTARPLLRAKRIRRFALKICLDFQESYDRSFFSLCTCFMQ